MSDAMTDMYRAERRWNRAELLLGCYYGRNHTYTKGEAQELILKEFGRTPESLKRYMYS